MKVLLFADGEIGLFVLNQVQSRPEVSHVSTVMFEHNKLLPVSKNDLVFEGWNNPLLEHINRHDLVILAWWPRIIPNDFLKLVKTNIFNLHPSLLPFGRGKDPNFWAIVDQTPFGVTIHQVVSKIDYGPIVANRDIPYGWEDTGGTLYEKAVKEIKSLFAEQLPILLQKNVKLLAQPDSRNFPTRRREELIQKSTIILDEYYTAREFLNILRAKTIDGFPGAIFVENNIQYEIRISINRIK